jgi:hypothetical protein
MRPHGSSPEQEFWSHFDDQSLTTREGLPRTELVAEMTAEELARIESQLLARRVAAVVALGAIDTPESRKAVERALDDPNFFVRANVRACLTLGVSCARRDGESSPRATAARHGARRRDSSHKRQRH